MPASPSTRAALRRLPALRASLRWYRRELARELRQRAESASMPKLRAFYTAKAAKVARMPLDELRSSYEAERVRDITRARRSELAQAVPGIQWFTAEAA